MNSYICVAVKSGGGAALHAGFGARSAVLTVGSIVSSAHLVRVQQRLTRKWPNVRCEHTFDYLPLCSGCEQDLLQDLGGTFGPNRKR